MGDESNKDSSDAKAVEVDAQDPEEFSKVAPAPPASSSADEPVEVEAENAKRAHHAKNFLESGEDTKGPLLSLEEVVDEVLDDKWGTGKARADALRAAGYSVLKVEAEVQRRQGLRK